MYVSVLWRLCNLITRSSFLPLIVVAKGAKVPLRRTLAPVVAVVVAPAPSTAIRDDLKLLELIVNVNVEIALEHVADVVCGVKITGEAGLVALGEEVVDLVEGFGVGRGGDALVAGVRVELRGVGVWGGRG